LDLPIELDEVGFPQNMLAPVEETETTP